MANDSNNFNSELIDNSSKKKEPHRRATCFLLLGLQPLAPPGGRKKVMSSDSTSIEDEYERIKEAVDENFLTKDLYLNGKSKKKSQNLPIPTFLRNQSHQEISNNPFSVKVTPEFQRHVSKHLSKLLDEIIDDKKVIIKSRKLRENHLNYGIKLLCSSKDYLLCGNTVGKTRKSKKFSVKANLDANDYEKKAKEVAVTPDWVLSQEETKYWAPNTKGVIEIIKLDDCCKNLKRSKKKTKKPKS